MSAMAKNTKATESDIDESIRAEQNNLSASANPLHEDDSHRGSDGSSMISVSEELEARSIVSDVELAPDEGRLSINFGGRANELVDLLHPLTSVPETPIDPVDPLVQHLDKDASQCTLLNIVIQIVGTRGDVQPFIPIAQELKSFGHRVRIATHAAFQALVEGEGLEFFCIGGDPNALMAFMVKNPSLIPSMATVRQGDVSKRRRDIEDILQGCWRSCIEGGNGLDTVSAETKAPFVADAIIANPPSFAHVHCAERMAIPVHMMFTMPWTPTTAFSHPLASIELLKDENPGSANYVSYVLMEVMTWQGVGDLVNSFREQTLGLDPVGSIWMTSLMQKLRIPFTYCWSPALIPKPRDWKSHISISGFSFLDLPTDYTPPPELADFLAAGPPPIYIGFGSIVIDDPDALTEIVYAAIEKSGVRALLSRGSGGLGSSTIQAPPNVLLLGDCPHSWLFQRVSAVVHHGGAGTTAAGLAAGNPTVIVPFFGDQHFWGGMVARAGAGPKPIHWKNLTVDSLSDAISFAVQPSTKSAALRLSETIQLENGSQMAVQHFHAALPSELMICALDPQQTAVWTTKKNSSTIKLSAVGAALLVREGILKPEELKLHRAVNYETDPGPMEPVTASLTTSVRVLSNFGQALGNIAWGLATETGQQHNEGPNQAIIVRSADPNPPNASQPSGSSSAAMSEGVSAKSKTRFERTKRGLTSLGSAALRMPMDFTVKTAQGLNNLPQLYDDNTVRPTPRVTGIQSGLKAAGLGLALGTYDGISGLVTQPVRARHDGGAAVAAGVAKGIGGAILKPIAGVSGFFGYAMKGVQREFQKAVPKGIKVQVRSARLDQGVRELNAIEPWKQDRMLTTWEELVDRVGRETKTLQMVKTKR